MLARQQASGLRHSKGHRRRRHRMAPTSHSVEAGRSMRAATHQGSRPRAVRPGVHPSPPGPPWLAIGEVSTAVPDVGDRLARGDLDEVGCGRVTAPAASRPPPPDRADLQVGDGQSEFPSFAWRPSRQARWIANDYCTIEGRRCGCETRKYEARTLSRGAQWRKRSVRHK